MFGGKDKPQVNNDIPILTIDHYPGREYEVIGMVTAKFDDPHVIKSLNQNGITGKLQEEARTVNADAVIGTRMYQFNAATIVGYGTAIKFK